MVLNLFPVPFAAAQEEEVQEEKEYELGTITVTGQKREEDIQEVPASITALSHIQIEDAAIKDIEDLTYYTPNLDIQKMGNHVEQYPIIRGMFNNLNPTVGVFVDGVSYSHFMAYDPDLYDIERIEVLRGPQGTLFGRNTEAGAIRIITKKPGNIWEGKAFEGYGSYDSQDYSATIHGSLIKDRLFLGIGGKRYVSDGFFENDYLGTDEVVIFENQPLVDILRELEEYHQVKLLADPELWGKRLTGTIGIRDLDQALEIITTATSLRIEREAEGTIVLRK